MTKRIKITYSSGKNNTFHGEDVVDEMTDEEFEKTYGGLSEDNRYDSLFEDYAMDWLWNNIEVGVKVVDE